jgi:hypothetical protein
MTQRNYGLKPDNRPIYEPAPERSPRVSMVLGILALAATIALAWVAAIALHFIGGAL